MNTVPGRRDAAATVLGFVALYLLLEGSARLSGSTRGEAGLQVLAVVLAAALVIERALAGESWRDTALALGLGAPDARTLRVTAIGATAVLLMLWPLARCIDVEPVLRRDAGVLVAGIFGQAGVAEEVVFRGFLFRRLRATRPFWQAAWLAALPFVIVHVALLASLPFEVACTALGLSIAMAGSLAWLFERAGGSVWPAAIVHATAQGALKLLEDGDPAFPRFAIAWMLLCAAMPWVLVAALSRRDR